MMIVILGWCFFSYCLCNVLSASLLLEILLCSLLFFVALSCSLTYSLVGCVQTTKINQLLTDLVSFKVH